MSTDTGHSSLLATDVTSINSQRISKQPHLLETLRALRYVQQMIQDQEQMLIQQAMPTVEPVAQVPPTKPKVSPSAAAPLVNFPFPLKPHHAHTSYDGRGHSMDPPINTYMHGNYIGNTKVPDHTQSLPATAIMTENPLVDVQKQAMPTYHSGKRSPDRAQHYSMLTPSNTTPDSFVKSRDQEQGSHDQGWDLFQKVHAPESSITNGNDDITSDITVVDMETDTVQHSDDVAILPVASGRQSNDFIGIYIYVCTCTRTGVYDIMYAPLARASLNVQLLLSRPWPLNVLFFFSPWLPAC